jgi:hypothetical protein
MLNEKLRQEPPAEFCNLHFAMIILHFCHNVMSMLVCGRLPKLVPHNVYAFLPSIRSMASDVWYTIASGQCGKGLKYSKVR